MGAARSAGGMRLRAGKKASREDIPTAAEAREIQRKCVHRAGGGVDYRRGMKWFSEYARLLEREDAWSPERAQAVMEMTVRLLKQKADRAKVQKRVSTVFYCLAVVAWKNGISPRAIVNVEPLGFGAARNGRAK